MEVKKVKQHAGSGALYGTGVIGALFYFLPHAHTIGAVIVGIIESFFWPAIMVFKALEYLKI